ncbi:hypothetical protein PybrP1_010729 [[Pythium] brassicae (nom. inval.)]|nr:hypothetical protein PybrP1_010729 [[Pythium] brassicae (nom. inval.)]
MDTLTQKLAAGRDMTDGSGQRMQHTYHFSVDGIGHSSRLDRWYISEQHGGWARYVKVMIPGISTDHDGVGLRVASPHMRMHIKRAQKVYPVRSCGQEIASANKIALFAELTSELDGLVVEYGRTHKATIETASWWDEVKTLFRLMYIAAA